MTDKLIKADTSRRTEKTFNAVSVIAIIFIIITATFMGWQQFTTSQELDDTQLVATAFAEGIQTMCSEQSIRDRYARMCTLAENYAERSEFLNEEQPVTPDPARDIKDITCSGSKATIEYDDGSVTETNAQCDTTDK